MIERCKICQVNKRVNEERAKGNAACCKWFLDNGICGHEDSTDHCPDFEPLEAEE